MNISSSKPNHSDLGIVGNNLFLLQNLSLLNQCQLVRGVGKGNLLCPNGIQKGRGWSSGPSLPYKTLYSTPGGSTERKFLKPNENVCQNPGGTSIYGLYWYVPRDRVGLNRVSFLPL